MDRPRAWSTTSSSGALLLLVGTLDALSFFAFARGLATAPAWLIGMRSQSGGAIAVVGATWSSVGQVAVEKDGKRWRSDRPEDRTVDANGDRWRLMETIPGEIAPRRSPVRVRLAPSTSARANERTTTVEVSRHSWSVLRISGSGGCPRIILLESTVSSTRRSYVAPLLRR